MRGSKQIVIFYDQSCPSCVRDRQLFERLAGSRARLFCWFDITGQQDALIEQGIEPLNALRELHVQDLDGSIYSAIEAYSLLLKQIPWFFLLGVSINLPLIKPLLTSLYRRSVDKRLACEGRL